VTVKARLVAAAVVGAALVATPSAALGSASRAAGNSQSYPDSVGEDPNAPDITGIDVSNDDAGLITFHVKISNRPTFTSDMVLLAWIDKDNNPATGDPKFGGADDVIQIVPGAVGLFDWNGNPVSSQTSVTYSYDPSGATFTVSSADLGGVKTIRFVVGAFSGVTTDANGNADFTNAHADFAPDPGHGLYSYDVLTKLTLKTVAFTTAPKPARAGARFSASLAGTESDTGGPIKKATITCIARVKGVGIRATHSLTNGVATCYWKLPKKAKGKTLRGTIVVTVQGTTLTKSFSVKIA